jgi:hypothetical protein
MVIRWRLQFIFSVLLAIVTFFTSMINNTLPTSLIRAAMGLLLFLIVGVILQYLLNHLPTKGPSEKEVDGLDVGREIDPQTEEVASGDLSFQSVPLNSLHKRED